MRRLLLSAALLALLVGCEPAKNSGQTASPPPNAYGDQPQRPKPDGEKKDGEKPDGEKK